MGFFSGIENFFLVKRTNKYTAIVFLSIYLFFSFCGILICILEGAIFGALIIVLIALLSIILTKEIKLLHTENDLLVFQKDLISNSYDASSSAYFIFSETGKLIYLNDLAGELFPNTMIKNIGDFINIFSRYNKILPAVQNVQAAVESGRAAHIDTPVVLDIDTSVCWRIFASPISGFKRYTLWSITDLTPSFKNLDVLDANATFLLDVINAADEALFSINEQGIFMFCNNTFAKLLDLPISSIVGSNLKDFVVQEGSDPFPVVTGGSRLTQAIPSQIIFFNSIKHQPCELMVKYVWTSKDGYLHTYSAIRKSCSENKLAEVLGTTKMYFEKIFEDAPVGIAITDGAEIIDACNRTFRDLTGYSNLQMDKEVSILDFVADDCKDNVKNKLYELLNAIYSSEKPIEVQIKGLNKLRTVTIYANKLNAEHRGKKDNGLVLYFIDITVRKELQNQFVQSQKMQAIGQLAGGVAHDFNNLLTAMIGYCDLLLAKCKPTDQAFSDIMQIKQNANRASNLVRQLLAFSRQQTLQPKVMNVTDMIVDLSVLLNRLLGAKIELVVNHGRDIGCIKVDQVQFEQVIINLAVNSRDAMPNGGKLTIKTENYHNEKQQFLRGEIMPAGAYILISIADTGCGISETLINRIFDPFFSTKEKGHGTGLGLSTVYGIVKQTGGFINVESAINEGTKFNLYFPMCTCELQQKAKSAYQESQPVIQADLTGSGKILLVEDEDAVRMFSARALRDKGYSVIEAPNGESALEFIKNDGGTIDLMITDVVMPKMDGPTLINYVEEFAPGMKVIFISGYTEDSFRKSLANSIDVHFLQKPFSLKDLALKVKEVIMEEKEV